MVHLDIILFIFTHYNFIITCLGITSFYATNGSNF